MAGVSPATVSNVLTGRRVRAESAQRVKEAASSLGYAVDRAASQLRSGRARVVAMLVPSLENPFFTSIVAAVERRLRTDDHDLVVASAADDVATEHSRLQALLSWRPAGMIVIPCTDDFAGASLLAAAGTPYVVLDRVGGAHSADTVAVDNVTAGLEAARHLIDLGHRRLLIVASARTLSNIKLRCKGIVEACAAAGLEEPALIEVGFDLESAVDRLQTWLSTHERPSGIIALTNFATLGALASLARFSVSIPGEVSLVGFDDYAWMRAAAPSITAIRQPVEAMAELVWDRLRARIDGDSSPVVQAMLPVSLVIRASTARCQTGDPAAGLPGQGLRRPSRTGGRQREQGTGRGAKA
ncbi:transcriptional regulator, LacI family [Arboricoccus pini]|uniref:Transcriptional regulator, LacI family n=1 Tax=Arboricoccus pini TaxID=1963835 RepID=A0A212S174_9PROT|nr:transcriptional regulator, LacI family [Arboricoccus pini]